MVLVHGLWMRPWVLEGWSWWLRRAGFTVCRFGYASRRESVAAAAHRLSRWVDGLPAGPVDLMGHSLGGRVAAAVPSSRVRRVVAVGTPFLPSAAARALALRRWGHWWGGAGLAELLNAAPPANHPTAVLAGTRGIGLGRLSGTLTSPHDGTVAVAETWAPWLADHGCLPVSHSSALIDHRVVVAAVGFFRHGRLSRPPVVDCPP